MKKLLFIILGIMVIILFIAIFFYLNKEKLIPKNQGLNTDIYSNKNIDIPQAELETNNHENLGDDNLKKINLNINGKTFAATLYDNTAVDELIERLPITITMKDLNSNEKYYYFDDNFTTDVQNVGSIKAGDIMLYGNNCLVIFYEDFSTSYRYTKIGHIDNTNKLQDALGNSSIKITIEK